MAQRIVRAKQRIKSTGSEFQLPPPSDWDDRLQAVLHVLYLVFNEGYTASSGNDLNRTELTGEAIRLTRAVRRLLPDDGEVAGLLALMLLTDARRPARTGPDGSLIPLDEQDRSRWHAPSIEEGLASSPARSPTGRSGRTRSRPRSPPVHAEAAHAGDTDWPQIVALYELLQRLSPNPVVALNHAVAVAMAKAPGRDWLCSTNSRRTSASRATTASTRSGRICWRWRATPPRRRRATAGPREGRRADPNGATSSPAPTGSAEPAEHWAP
jgi:predicted RNA polymerase sigma factor